MPEPIYVPAGTLLKPEYRIDLIGHWKMNTGGVLIPDLSGNGNHGTRTNMANPPTATSGWAGQGDILDGVDDYILTPTINHNIGTGDFTWSAWVYPLVLEVWRAICANVSYVPAFYLHAVSLYIYWGRTYSFGSSLSLINNWYHVVVKREGGIFSAYKNGVKQPTSFTLATSMVNATFCIGSESYGGAFWNGLIDDVRIYNRALSADEIAHSCFQQEDEWDWFDEDIYIQQGIPIELLQSGRMMY